MPTIVYKDQFNLLKAAVSRLYFAAHWYPDRECDAPELWKAVRDAAGLPVGMTREVLGPPRADWGRPSNWREVHDGTLKEPAADTGDFVLPS